MASLNCLFLLILAAFAISSLNGKRVRPIYSDGYHTSLRLQPHHLHSSPYVRPHFGQYLRDYLRQLLRQHHRQYRPQWPHFGQYRPHYGPPGPYFGQHITPHHGSHHRHHGHGSHHGSHGSHHRQQPEEMNSMETGPEIEMPEVEYGPPEIGNSEEIGYPGEIDNPGEIGGPDEGYPGEIGGPDEGYPGEIGGPDEGYPGENGGPDETGEFGGPGEHGAHGRPSESGDPMEKYYRQCRAYALVRKERTIFSPFFSEKQYPANITCKFAFIGDTTCTPELSCQTLELRKIEDDCSSEFLKISDGFGGQKVFCGNTSFTKPLTASHSARDLYVEFQSAKGSNLTGNFAGFQCEVKCSQDVDKTEILPVVKPRKQDDRCVCGLHNKDDRIVGGEDAKFNEFPWLAAIVQTGTRQAACAGSIINDRFILTASHCFAGEYPTDPAGLEVLLHAHVLDMTYAGKGHNSGEIGTPGGTHSSGWNLSKVTDEDEKTQRFKVVEIITHPLFKPNFDYDVCLLKLDRKIDFTAHDAPIPVCIPGPGLYDRNYESEVPTVAGWGTGDETAGGSTRVLQKLNVPVLNLQNCEEWMRTKLTQRMICAGFEEGQRDACQGDSGGPLVLEQSNQQWRQIGVVSWGEGCARAQKPGFYSRLTEMTQWINYQTMSQDAVWCKDTK